MNILKSDHQFTIEVYPHGWLLCPADTKRGIPISALQEAMPLFPKGAVMDAGIAVALGAVFAIGVPAKLDDWRKQITKMLSSNLPPEIAWVRGVDVGLSSLSLFSRLVINRHAAMEANDRIGGINRNDTPTHHPKDGDDFGRCHRMIEKLGPCERLALFEARDLSPEWASIIDRWGSLVELMKAGKLGIIEFPKPA